MHVDCLIIGQGICGTFLSWYLDKAGLSCLVIDAPQPSSSSELHPSANQPHPLQQPPHPSGSLTRTASRSAAGLINPVTGRRIVTTWMIDELLPFAQNAYHEIGIALGAQYMKKKELVDFFPSVQMRQAFLDRYATDQTYLNMPADEQHWNNLFHYELGYGLIDPCFLVDLPGILSAARNRLLQQDALREEIFHPQELIAANAESGNQASLHYRDITANRVIFCDGLGSTSNPWFERLPFAPNKGEALILEIPGLPHGIYKKGLTLAPWSAGPDLFWVGSSYEWSFTDGEPTAAFRDRTEALLKSWLKLPFKILDHFAAVRPATLERRPFIGFHPSHPNIGIFNGMGTKGCSLAPYFANQLTQHILSGTPIRPDASVQRFSKILSR